MSKVTNNLDDLPTDGFIRQAQLIPNIVPFSSATLWRQVKSGEFPKPVKLSIRITAWRVQDVREWLNKMYGDHKKLGG
jgi:prophage regulatory protein